MATSVQQMINRNTGVNRNQTRAARTRNLRTVLRRNSRGGGGG